MEGAGRAAGSSASRKDEPGVAGGPEAASRKGKHLLPRQSFQGTSASALTKTAWKNISSFKIMPHSEQNKDRLQSLNTLMGYLSQNEIIPNPATSFGSNDGPYLIQQIQTGEFSRVLSANLSPGQPLADNWISVGSFAALKCACVKGVPSDFSDEANHYLRKEIDVLTDIGSHKTIIEFFASFEFLGKKRKRKQSPYCQVAIMMLCKIDMYGFCTQRFDKELLIPEREARKLMLHTSDGLLYLHENGIVHGDFKPENILLGYDDYWKLSDLGCAKKIKPEEETFRAHKYDGTHAYMAPELVTPSLDSTSLENVIYYSYCSDCWACGMTLMFLGGYNPVLYNYYEAVNKVKSRLDKAENLEERMLDRESVYNEFLDHLVSEETRTPYLHREESLNIRSHLVGIWGEQYQSHFLGDFDDKESLKEIQNYFSQREVNLKRASSETSKLYNQEIVVLGLTCMRLKESARLGPALLKEYQEKWFKEHPSESAATANVASEQGVSKDVQ